MMTNFLRHPSSIPYTGGYFIYFSFFSVHFHFVLLRLVGVENNRAWQKGWSKLTVYVLNISTWVCENGFIVCGCGSKYSLQLWCSWQALEFRWQTRTPKIHNQIPSSPIELQLLVIHIDRIRSSNSFPVLLHSWYNTSTLSKRRFSCSGVTSLIV